MKILKTLVLLLSLFSVSFSLLPPSPGQVDHRQYYDQPTTLYYGNGNLNGIQTITQTGCNQANTINLQQVYNPIIIIDENSYLASNYNNNTGSLDISVISNQGPSPIQIQSNFADYLKNNRIATGISYDDKRNTFVFKNTMNEIVEYRISTDTVSVKKASGFIPYSEYYYDLTTSSVYTAAYYNYSGTIYGFVLVYNLARNSDFSYSMDDLKLTYEMDSYNISTFNGSVVLFGNSKSLSKSALYLAKVSFFSKENSSQLIAERPYGYKMITGVNNRYVLLVSEDGSSTELFDLKTLTSQQLSNTCTETNYNSAFISSIAAKSIFSN